MRLQDLKRRFSATMLPVLWSGAGATIVYGVAEIVTCISSRRQPELWTLVLLLYIALAAALLALVSLPLGSILSALIRSPIPQVIRVIWGGLLGAGICLIVDGPHPNVYRWLPYAVAIAAGVLAALAFNRARRRFLRAESRGGP